MVWIEVKNRHFLIFFSLFFSIKIIHVHQVSQMKLTGMFIQGMFVIKWHKREVVKRVKVQSLCASWEPSALPDIVYTSGSSAFCWFFNHIHGVFIIVAFTGVTKPRSKFLIPEVHNHFSCNVGYIIEVLQRVREEKTERERIYRRLVSNYLYYFHYIWH